MLDPKYLREHIDFMKKVINSGRGNPMKADVDKWLLLDNQRIELVKKRDDINSQRNILAKQGKTEQTQEFKDKGKLLKETSQKLETELEEVTQKWQEILDWMPNAPLEEMPEGKGEEDNIVDKLWIPKTGYVKTAEGKKARGFTEALMPTQPLHAVDHDFIPKHHLDLAENLGLVDIKQSGKVSGSRFTYLLGDLVLLQYAIQQLLFNELITRGFKPFISPLLVKERALYGTSHFPEQRSQVYAIQSDNVEEQNQLYLLGSTEPANFAYFMDRTLEVKDLPYKLFAYAPAFRSEAGSWGKDMKGIKRLHQFDKIEMNAVTTQEQSTEVFKEFLSINEWLLQALELPYQLSKKCTGDAGYLASAMQVDPEVWLPGQNEFMEVMTDTNATDYQARRLGIKYKDVAGNLKYAHTVNDTGCAMGRILIAILCNYQQKDGSIKVPEILKKYVSFDVITRK